MKKIVILNGPNLHRLVSRESNLYGTVTLPDLNQQLIQQAAASGFLLSCIQTNNEEQFIDAIYQVADDQAVGLIVNAAAFTHTSIAIRDALLAVALPFIEVHITNIYAREIFRQHSYLSDIAQGIIVGLGVNGYALALQALIAQQQQQSI